MHSEARVPLAIPWPTPGHFGHTCTNFMYMHVYTVYMHVHEKCIIQSKEKHVQPNNVQTGSKQTFFDSARVEDQAMMLDGSPYT